jgi:hypothetical protein
LGSEPREPALAREIFYGDTCFSGCYSCTLLSQSREPLFLSTVDYICNCNGAPSLGDLMSSAWRSLFLGEGSAVSSNLFGECLGDLGLPRAARVCASIIEVVFIN